MKHPLGFKGLHVTTVWWLMSLPTLIKHFSIEIKLTKLSEFSLTFHVLPSIKKYTHGHVCGCVLATPNVMNISRISTKDVLDIVLAINKEFRCKSFLHPNERIADIWKIVFWTLNKLLRCKVPVHKAKTYPVKISMRSGNFILVIVHKFHTERTSQFFSCIDIISVYVWWISRCLLQEQLSFCFRTVMVESQKAVEPTALPWFCGKERNTNSWWTHRRPNTGRYDLRVTLALCTAKTFRLFQNACD